MTDKFWYSLKALHYLTGQGGWELRMDIKLANGTNIFLQYEQFEVASAIDKYRLNAREFRGITTDPMVIYFRMNLLVAIDSDNDVDYQRNCPLGFSQSEPCRGWWFRPCWSFSPYSYSS